MQEPTEKKNSYLSLQALLLGSAIVVAAGIAYRLWPTAEGFWQTAKAAAGLNEEVSLTGISYTEDSRLAIVNGEMVHEGDVTDGVKVLRIHKDQVEFERSGKRWSQRIPAAEEDVGSPLPVLLELGSHRCPPCRQMTPILKELRTKYAKKFRVRYIDVDKNSTAGSKYGIRAIPTQIFFDSEGTEVFRHVGFYSKKEILATWKELGVKF